MSEDTDRIPVPTNGKGPHRDVLEATTGPAAEPAAEPASSGEVPREQTLAFTPNQLAAGFGIVAGLVLLFAARRRRGRG
jgi:hypothetical protein